MYIAAIFAFAPTLILMYIVLKKYTYPAVEQPFFSDPRLFGLFAVGLIAGILLFAFYTYLNRGNLIHMALYSVVQCLAMVIVMNLKRFHGKSDSVFYGYGLGLGMGCTMAFGTIWYTSSLILNMTDGGFDALSMIILFIMALSNILILSAIGTTVGEGIARLRPMEFALQAIFVNMFFNVILVIGYSDEYNSMLIYGGIIASFIFSAIYFYFIMYVKLSGVVKDVLRMEGNTRKDIPK